MTETHKTAPKKEEHAHAASHAAHAAAPKPHPETHAAAHQTAAAKPHPETHAHPEAGPHAHQAQARAAAPKKKKAPAQKKQEAIVARGKRKESVARAAVRKGKGVVRVNRMSLSAIGNRYVRDMIAEPLGFAPELCAGLDIDIEVSGGGQMGQAQACRVALAKALVGYSKDDSLRQRMLGRDRSLLIEDSRRVEPKKYKGPKARARFQKSYR